MSTACIYINSMTALLDSSVFPMDAYRRYRSYDAIHDKHGDREHLNEYEEQEEQEEQEEHQDYDEPFFSQALQVGQIYSMRVLLDSTTENSDYETGFFRVDKVLYLGMDAITSNITWLYTPEQISVYCENNAVGDQFITDKLQKIQHPRSLFSSTHREKRIKLHRNNISLVHPQSIEIVGVFCIYPTQVELVCLNNSDTQHSNFPFALLQRGSRSVEEVERFLRILGETPCLETERFTRPREGKCDLCGLKRTITSTAVIGEHHMVVGSYCIRALTLAHRIMHSHGPFPLDEVEACLAT